MKSARPIKDTAEAITEAANTITAAVGELAVILHDVRVLLEKFLPAEPLKAKRPRRTEDEFVD